MRAVLRIQGFRLYFWSREPNEPSHVHVDRAGASAKVWLEPVTLASNTGYPAHELGGILRLVRALAQIALRFRCQPGLLEAWHEFVGTG